jgi:hypothetical protein
MAIMMWIFAGVGLATAGLAILAVLAARVLTAARGLGRELDRTNRRLQWPEDEHQMAGAALRAGRG